MGREQHCYTVYDDDINFDSYPVTPEGTSYVLVDTARVVAVAGRNAIENYSRSTGTDIDYTPYTTHL